MISRFLDNLPMAGKLGAGFGLVCLIFLAALFAYRLTLQTVSSDYDTLLSQPARSMALARGIENDMLQARRSEKDFLARKDLKYVDKVAASVGQVAEKAEKLKAVQQASGNEQGVRDAEAISQYIAAYQKAFAATVAAWQRRGLDHESGLQGALRGEVHALEETLGKVDEQLSSYASRDVMVEMLMLRRHEKDYLLRGLDKYVDKTNKRLDVLREKTSLLPVSGQEKTGMTSRLDAYDKAFNALVKEDTVIATNIAALREQVHKIEPLVASVVERANKRMATMEQETIASAETGQQSAAAMGGISLVAAVLITIFTTRRITVPLNKGAGYAGRVAQGDLTETFETNRHDEIGRITGALSEMGNRLKDVIAAIQESVASVAAGSEELSASSENLSQGSTEQAAAVEEVSASIEQLMANIRQTTDAANRTEAIAVSNAQDATKGGTIINDAVESMHKIAERITIIEDIARQTNLLALNAPSRRPVQAKPERVLPWWRQRFASWRSEAALQPGKSASFQRSASPLPSRRETSSNT